MQPTCPANDFWHPGNFHAVLRALQLPCKDHVELLSLKFKPANGRAGTADLTCLAWPGQARDQVGCLLANRELVSKQHYKT